MLKSLKKINILWYNVGKFKMQLFWYTSCSYANRNYLLILPNGNFDNKITTHIRQNFCNTWLPGKVRWEAGSIF